MKLSEKVDLFTGVISSGNTPALGPVAEELKLLTIFVDGCTDFLFDKAVPNPHYIFRITNMQSADGVTCAIATAMTWPKVKRIAHIHPDYSYGRNAFDHFNIVMKKMVPRAQVVSEGWPKLGTTDFTSHITKTIAAKPDLLVSSVWGGDYVAMYKQALRYDLFKKMKFASTIAFGVAPHAIGKDHPEGRDRGRPLQLLLQLPAQQPLAVQRHLREEVLRALEGVPELPVRGRVLHAVHAQDRGGARQQARRRLARRRRHHRPARRADAPRARRATSTSGPTTTRATRTR